MDAEAGFHLERFTLDGAGSTLLFLSAGMSSGSASLARFLGGCGGGGAAGLAAGTIGGPAG